MTKIKTKKDIDKYVRLFLESKPFYTSITAKDRAKEEDNYTKYLTDIFLKKLKQK